MKTKTENKKTVSHNAFLKLSKTMEKNQLAWKHRVSKLEKGLLAEVEQLKSRIVKFNQVVSSGVYKVDKEISSAKIQGKRKYTRRGRGTVAQAVMAVMKGGKPMSIREISDTVEAMGIFVPKDRNGNKSQDCYGPVANFLTTSSKNSDSNVTKIKWGVYRMTKRVSPKKANVVVQEEGTTSAAMVQ